MLVANAAFFLKKKIDKVGRRNYTNDLMVCQAFGCNSTGPGPETRTNPSHTGAGKVQAIGPINKKQKGGFTECLYLEQSQSSTDDKIRRYRRGFDVAGGAPATMGCGEGLLPNP